MFEQLGHQINRAIKEVSDALAVYDLADTNNPDQPPTSRRAWIGSHLVTAQLILMEAAEWSVEASKEDDQSTTGE